MACALAENVYPGAAPLSPIVVEATLPAMLWFHLPGDTRQPNPICERPKFNLASYVGRFSPDLERRILGPQPRNCKSGEVRMRRAQPATDAVLGSFAKLAI